MINETRDIPPIDSEAPAVVGVLKDRCFRTFDGVVYFNIPGMGRLASDELRAIADEMDRLTKLTPIDGSDHTRVLNLSEFHWDDLSRGTYHIVGVLEEGPVKYNLNFTGENRDITLYIHTTEPGLRVDKNLIGKMVVATVAKTMDWSASLLEVREYI